MKYSFRNHQNLLHFRFESAKVDWRRENKFWIERGVTQMGAQGNPIISNTRTTIDACHRVLREFTGVAELTGASP